MPVIGERERTRDRTNPFALNRSEVVGQPRHKGTWDARHWFGEVAFLLHGRRRRKKFVGEIVHKIAINYCCA